MVQAGVSQCIASLSFLAQHTPDLIDDLGGSNWHTNNPKADCLLYGHEDCLLRSRLCKQSLHVINVATLPFLYTLSVTSTFTKRRRPGTNSHQLRRHNERHLMTGVTTENELPKKDRMESNERQDVVDESLGDNVGSRTQERCTPERDRTLVSSRTAKPRVGQNLPECCHAEQPVRSDREGDDACDRQETRWTMRCL